MNRLPQESHSPTRRPSSSVVNRSGAPHCRHGRLRGPSPSARPLGGPRRAGASSVALPRSARNVVVASQSVQTARSRPPRPVRNSSGAPHSSHAGAFSATRIGAPTGVAVDASSAAGKCSDNVVPSTKATSFAHVGHVPVRSTTDRSENSISAPQDGHVLDIGLLVSSHRAQISWSPCSLERKPCPWGLTRASNVTDRPCK